MCLGLVIPVRDDHLALERLLNGVAELGVFNQIVVVDDGSAFPITTDKAQVFRQDPATGPGPARNFGLNQIKTDHVLFFDSDDEITNEIVPLWRDLEQQDFDFCLFRHADTRQIAQGNWHQMREDDALWKLAGMGGFHLKPVCPNSATWLAQTANYPWNKIYRTNFLREAEIRFPDLRLHEDIAPHWQSFARAKTILASDRICATHTVSLDGARMTNARGRERINAIFYLREIGYALHYPLRGAFLHFISGLFDWIFNQIDPKWQAELSDSVREFWLYTLQSDDEERLISNDPVLALRIGLQMAGRLETC